MPYRLFAILVALAILIHSAPSLAQLQKLYTTDLEPGRSSLLYELDVNTGTVVRTIGDTGERIVAIASLGADLIAVTAADSTTPDAIVRIHTDNGAISPIKPLPASIVQEVRDLSAPVNGPDLLTLLQEDNVQAINVLTDPTPFLNEQPWALSFFDSQPDFPGQYGFVAGNLGLVSGSSGLIGSILVGCSLTDGSSQLQIFSQFIVDGGPVADPPPPVPDPTFFDLPDLSCFSAAASSINRELFAVAVAPDLAAARSLATVNLETGAVTILNVLPDFAHGLAFGNAPPPQVPTLGQYGLMLLAVLLLLLTVVRLRQKQ